MALFLIILILIIFSALNNKDRVKNNYNYEIMGGSKQEYENNSQDQTIVKFNSISFQSSQNINQNIDLNSYKLISNKIAFNDLNKNRILNSNQDNTIKKIDSSNIDQKINFILPTLGLNWGKLHPKNAVDIAASCGNDILAAADGLIIDLANSGWNSGYGKYIKIEHLNNVKTFYAHLNSLNVSIGDYVKQGQKIGTVGQTGESTGCHLHFEVLGDKNPFIKK